MAAERLHKLMYMLWAQTAPLAAKAAANDAESGALPFASCKAADLDLSAFHVSGAEAGNLEQGARHGAGVEASHA